MKIGQVRLTGGAGSSKIWGEIIANVLGKRTQVPQIVLEGTALGVALVAGVGVGVFKDLDEAQEHIGLNADYAPDENIHRRYLQLYGAYQNLHSILNKVAEDSVRQEKSAAS